MQIQIHSNRSEERKVITTTATTYGELKPVLESNGISTSNRKFVMRAGTGASIEKLSLEFDNTPLLEVASGEKALLYVYAAKMSSGADVTSTKEAVLAKIEELKAETSAKFDALIGTVNNMTAEDLDDYEATAAEIGASLE